MKLNNLNELFLYLLSDIYRIENQLVKDMPKMIKKAYSEELKTGLEHHLNETKEQVKHLDKIFKQLKQQPIQIEWASDITNLFSDIEAFLMENTTSPVLDAAIIAVAQRIEHIEIATYGTLCSYAKALHLNDIEDILCDIVKEEGNADKLLTKVAEGGLFREGINEKAKVGA